MQRCISHVHLVKQLDGSRPFWWCPVTPLDFGRSIGFIQSLPFHLASRDVSIQLVQSPEKKQTNKRATKQEESKGAGSSAESSIGEKGKDAHCYLITCQWMVEATGLSCENRVVPQKKFQPMDNGRVCSLDRLEMWHPVAVAQVRMVSNCHMPR